jgi:hypothetical protein
VAVNKDGHTESSLLIDLFSRKGENKEQFDQHFDNHFGKRGGVGGMSV